MAAALQACGRLPKDLNISTVVPADYALEDLGYIESGGKDQSFRTPLGLGEQAYVVVAAPHPPLAPIVEVHEKDQEIKRLKQLIAGNAQLAEIAELKREVASLTLELEARPVGVPPVNIPNSAVEQSEDFSCSDGQY